MADFCQLILDRTVVPAGEQVRGHLIFLDAHVDLDRCQRLVVECHARVHGSGNQELVNAGEPLARNGAIQLPLKVPFEFTVPADGPVSFQGRYVKIDWEVEVRLDVPWAVDPRLKFPFQVVPRGAL